MRCTKGIIWLVVILTIAIIYADGTHDGEHNDGIPTIQECRPHIEAALRLYQSGELDLDSQTADDDKELDLDAKFDEINEPQDEGELEQHDKEHQGYEQDDNTESDDDNDDDDNETEVEQNLESAADGADEDDDVNAEESFEIRSSDEDKENSANSELEDETEEPNNLEDEEDIADDAEDENAQIEHSAGTDEEQDEETENEDEDEPRNEQNEELGEVPENESEGSEAAGTEEDDEPAETEDAGEEHTEQMNEAEGSDEGEEEDEEHSTPEERSTDADNESESRLSDIADEHDAQVGEDHHENGAFSQELDDNEQLVENSDSDETQADTEEHVVVDTTKAEDGEQEEEEEEEEVTVSGPGPQRTRVHIEQILHLDDDGIAASNQRERASAESLRNLKRMYEATIKPLEGLYKFKDISNRHLGDAELFSQPIVVFFGPLGSGKSAMVNYLLGIEDTHSAIKTGTDPNSNFFNVLMHGDSEQMMDGTQLAADWAFSSLQKFGQSFLDRLRGRKLANALLRKVTIVDTPGISEHRKSNERVYPFNDVCQWFIDRADLIFVVFDPSKLDIGMELEALFDQLKGRESHVRLLLNKADTVSPVELMRAQSALLWNLSPLVGTPEPPSVFAGSFWSRPYHHGSAAELLFSSEVALLEDIKEAVENRVENKVALARRHAVRVRNHAKMVDCYLTTYYNHKSFFSNKRKVADEIVENPHMYRIYEGLSTLANVSRYDLPDPDIYRDFFRLNPLFDFKPLASTCSYFKGCPLDKLDITIAYDLPELVSKYQKALRALGAH